MTFMEANIRAIKEVARQSSGGENIDKHWKRILPEVIDFAGHEIFLIVNRRYINGLMKQNAARFAQTFPPRDIGNFNNAELWLHNFVREWWLRLSADREFQALVDEHRRVIYNTTDPVVLVKPSRIWLPHFDGIDRQIYISLVERYNQFFFAQRCWAELMSRAQRDPYVKHTFMLVVNPTRLRQDFHRERNEANRWLCNESRRIATGVGAQPDVGEDARQDWLVKLFPLSPHQQIHKAGATGKAIRDGAIDMQRKGGQYKPIHLDDLDDRLINDMPDTSTIDSHEGIDVKELLQCLQSHRSEVEKVLSKGKPKLGKRRFKVIEMLAHTSCQKTIAKKLNISESTITRDIQIIEKARGRIREVLYD